MTKYNNILKHCLFPVQCRDSLGMQSGDIPDSAITASSSFDDDTVGPKFARYGFKLQVILCPKDMFMIFWQILLKTALFSFV